MKSNEDIPYSEEVFDGYVIRTFSKNLDESTLKWHTDDEDREVIPLNENDWKFQYDNKLPQPLDKKIFIREGQYHRVIKGTTDLIVKIIK